MNELLGLDEVTIVHDLEELYWDKLVKIMEDDPREGVEFIYKINLWRTICTRAYRQATETGRVHKFLLAAGSAQVIVVHVVYLWTGADENPRQAVRSAALMDIVRDEIQEDPAKVAMILGD